MAGPVIACAYCGGHHQRVADVRACWSRSAEQAPGPAATDRSPRNPADMAGPECLGRNLLVEGGSSLPAPWQGCEVVDIPSDLTAADRLADRLVAAAHARERLVFRVDPAHALAVPDQSELREPWRLAPSFRFTADLVHHVVTSNAVDLRPEDGARYPLTDRAVALGARIPTDGGADVVLPDGRLAYVDGGPIGFFSDEALGGADVALLHRVSIEHGSLVPLGDNECAAELAPDQLAAVTHPTGTARIVAPAGSGKTRVLTERARHLLAEWGLPPSAVCLVAYNVRAADEMRQRTTDLPRVQIRTLNSLALGVVNGVPPFGARSMRRHTVQEPAVRDLLGSLVDLPRRSNTDPAAAWLEALSSVRLGLRDPAEVEDEYRGDVDGLPEAFARFRTLLADRRLLDFDEQVYGAIDVLLREPDARRAAQRACRLLLVDEFQDLTPAHLLLLRLVAGPDGAVFGVGDDDQTIYGYAGASPQWLVRFEDFFPGAGEHALEVNYRCPPTVVAAADRLLRRNRVRVPKQIRPLAGRAAQSDDLVVLPSA
ncbi:MAG: ATP-dependent helicase, partial [Actinomycetota bacterium]|nr:ATP-dependent helicase [Actinomycetota bacterium]